MEPRTIPAVAQNIPAKPIVPTASPASRPAKTGTTTPVAAIGATRLMVPIESAW